MAVARVDINKTLIEWAIIRDGHEITEFLDVNPNVKQWLTGEKKPTIKQLEDFSRKVHVPFGYLFLDEPPEEELTFPFFRTGIGATSEVSLNVYDIVQQVQKRQDWLSDYLQEEGHAPLEFVGKFSVNTPFRIIVNDIRKTLGFQINWASKHNTYERALEFLTIQIEEIGIVTNFSGIVGNNTKRVINVEECRGFVLIDEYAPFMFINSADAKAAQMFTIIHELAHIWIGHSAGFDNQKLLPADDPIELLCDKIAAEFLVPRDSLLNIWQEETDFQKLNRIFKVSPIVVARRALDLELISRNDFFSFYNGYIDQINNIKQNRGSGGNFYATAKKRVSLVFASFVNNAVKEQKIMYKDAYKLTGLKGDTYANFMKEHLYQT
ncbi:MAG: ImmA/IrrE family metallo-endopeptidase [Bacteroidota bacterium]